MLIPILLFGLLFPAVPGLAQTEQSPYGLNPSSVRILDRFQDGISEGVERIQALDAKRESLKPTLEKEAEALRKLKEMSRGDPSILDTWKIRNMSKNFRVLAAQDQALSQAMRQEWKIIREYARTLAKRFESVIEDFIQKVEGDLVVHGQILGQDRKNFFVWASQHSQYQELSSFIGLPSVGSWLNVYSSGDWQVEVHDQLFMDRMIDKWKLHFEDRIQTKKREIKVLQKELRLRQRSDEIRNRSGGRLGLPLFNEEGQMQVENRASGPRSSATLQRMISTAERNIEMTKNGLPVLGKLRSTLSGS